MEAAWVMSPPERRTSVLAPAGDAIAAVTVSAPLSAAPMRRAPDVT
jgi:hypothetical protein